MLVHLSTANTPLNILSRC